LVTGGAGFIGSHIVDRLLEAGHQVLVLDDFSLGRKENLSRHENNKNLAVYRKSICDDLSGLFGLEKPGAVIHTAALPRVQFSIKIPWETHLANVDGTLNLLEHCRRFGVKRFVFSSSSSVYGPQPKLPANETLMPNPISPYALQKLVGEEYCRLYHRLYGVETLCLRYFNVFGPRQNPDGEYAGLIPKFIRLIEQGERPPINGDGEQTRDFTYVSGVVEANLLAAQTENPECFGQVFNVGSGRNLSVNAVTRELLKLCGSGLQPAYGPALLEPRNSLADVSKIRNLLGWSPAVSFETGIQTTHRFFAGRRLGRLTLKRAPV
jgi:nucleoside-diphosphate-sugar epimerase